MFTNMTLRHQAIIRSTLTLAWLTAAGSGLSALIFSPRTIIYELGAVLTMSSGALCLVFSLIAAFGVAFNRYRFEWFASWMAAAGIAPYLLSVWAFVFTGSPTRLTQAFMLTSLLVFMVLRAEFCAVHAQKLRTNHKDTGAINVQS